VEVRDDRASLQFADGEVSPSHAPDVGLESLLSHERSSIAPVVAAATVSAGRPDGDGLEDFLDQGVHFDFPSFSLVVGVSLIVAVCICTQ
jgi:hypothetical protein